MLATDAGRDGTRSADIVRDRREIGTYHYWSRCVQRAFLCSYDPDDNNFSLAQAPTPFAACLLAPIAAEGSLRTMVAQNATLHDTLTQWGMNPAVWLAKLHQLDRQRTRVLGTAVRVLQRAQAVAQWLSNGSTG